MLAPKSLAVSSVGVANVTACAVTAESLGGNH